MPHGRTCRVHNARRHRAGTTVIIGMLSLAVAVRVLGHRLGSVGTAAGMGQAAAMHRHDQDEPPAPAVWPAGSDVKRVAPGQFRPIEMLAANVFSSPPTVSDGLTSRRDVVRQRGTGGVGDDRVGDDEGLVEERLEDATQAPATVAWPAPRGTGGPATPRKRLRQQV